MTHGSSLEYLHSQIRHARVKSTSNRYFIPPSRVREIFSLKIIEAALAEVNCPDHDRIHLFENIWNNGVTTFAILVWMREADSIVKFRNSDHLDSKLPIDEKRAEDIASEIGLAFAREYQWEFLPYVFRKDMSDNHRQIHDLSLIFPIVEETDLGEGGFGQVSRLTIPSSMQEFITNVDGANVSIVRKRIKKHDRQSMSIYNESFVKEMACLRLLNRLNHRNIIPLLGTYTFNQQNYLLFPYLEMDLKAMFELENRLPEFQNDHTFYLALAGIASALEHTHELHLTRKSHGIDVEAIGYHFDIHPGNILVDRQRSTFILTDFGLGTLKTDKLNSETPWKIGGGDYIAPECMGTNMDYHKVGRAIDVWALGCLMADIATYMVLGHEGLQAFRESRWSELAPGWQTTYFYDARRSLKPSILSWLDRLSTISSSSTKRLLQIILNALDPHPHSRPRVQEIRYQLSALALRSLYDATINRFLKLLESVQGHEEHHGVNMRLWFEGERLSALGHALPHAAEDDCPIVVEPEMYSKFCDTLVLVAELIRVELVRLRSARSLVNIDAGQDFDDRIKTFVQKLWDILPGSLSRVAEAIWIQSKRKDDVIQLEGIEAHYRSSQSQNSGNMGAAAHMRAIRLRMMEDSSLGVREFLRLWSELDQIHLFNSKHYGVFLQNTRVLIEWMYYRPEWSNISDYQRLRTMELRAKDFNTDPKPLGLRVLKCLGFVERPSNDGEVQGYGFIYELPAGLDEGEHPISLHQLLMQGTNIRDDSYNQAPLSGRFRLAYALAHFFQELYTIDFLHESFASNNVIFADSAHIMFTNPSKWSTPYIVGFHRSRPDGQSWNTEGPSDDRSMLDYEHPDYRETGRFVVEYDYYSLGLVLLEIGLWCPMQLWSRKHKTLSPKEFRSLLLRKYVPRLTSSVGEAYRDAVQVCLDGTFEKYRAATCSINVDSKVFELFIWKVVDPLEKLARLRV